MRISDHLSSKYNINESLQSPRRSCTIIATGEAEDYLCGLLDLNLKYCKGEMYDGLMVSTHTLEAVGCGLSILRYSVAWGFRGEEWSRGVPSI